MITRTNSTNWKLEIIRILSKCGDVVSHGRILSSRDSRHLKSRYIDTAPHEVFYSLGIYYTSELKSWEKFLYNVCISSVK